MTKEVDIAEIGKSWHWSYTVTAIGATLGPLGINWVSTNTVINQLQITEMVFGFALLSFFPFRKFFRRKNYGLRNVLALFCLFGIGPLATLICLSLNVLIPVSNSYTEKYQIEKVTAVETGKDEEPKKIIFLKHNAYGLYRSTRTFYNKEFTPEDQYVTFTFHRGLFWLRQLEKAEFSKD